jgi:hypothetical protein
LRTNLSAQRYWVRHNLDAWRRVKQGREALPGQSSDWIALALASADKDPVWE